MKKLHIAPFALSTPLCKTKAKSPLVESYGPDNVCDMEHVWCKACMMIYYNPVKLKQAAIEESAVIRKLEKTDKKLLNALMGFPSLNK